MNPEQVEQPRRYRRSRIDTAFFAATFVAAVVVAVALQTSGVAAFFVWATVVVALIAAVAGLVIAGSGVDIDDETISVHRLGEDQSLSWIDVAGYYLPRRSARLGMAATPGPFGVILNGNGSRLPMRLESADGRFVIVPTDMPAGEGEPSLADAVQQRVMAQIYPPIRRTFDDGGVVTFGPVSLSRTTGLVFEDVRVPPSELGGYSLRVVASRLTLTRGAHERGDPSVRWDQIPNVDIFLALFYELKKTVPLPSWA